MASFAIAVALAVLAGIAGAAQAQGRLNFSWPVNVGPLDPHGYSPNQMFAQAMVYEPLVRYRADGTIEPWLATSWQASEDGRIYVFELRQNVSFSNGEPFNAEAVVANVDAIIAGRDSHSWLELANQIDAAEAIDRYRVRLRLREPYYPLLQELALPRPFRFIAPSQLNRGVGVPLVPIGTGPWVLAQTRLGHGLICFYPYSDCCELD